MTSPKLEIIPCPVCKFNSKKNLTVNLDNNMIDENIRAYGDMFAGLEQSSWQICYQCGFVYQNPRPSAQALLEYYTNSQYHSEIPAAWQDKENYMTFARWYYRKKIPYLHKKTLLKQAKVYEIGFGHGGFLSLLKDMNWKVNGSEPDTNLYNFSRDVVGLDPLENGLFNKDTQLNEPVDVVYSHHVFEHIADIDTVMEGIQKNLKIGGHVFTVIPTYFKNNTNMSLGWMNSAHYSMFTHKSLNCLFARYGLEEVSHKYHSSSGSVDEFWHIARYTGNKQNQNRYFENPYTVQRYIKYINPIRTKLYTIFYLPFVQRLNSRIQYIINEAITKPSQIIPRIMKKLGLQKNQV
jgi:2-polyprenyl-3-methyl-5-hydroxy-6-metoxy-1,4-benzoquinol methylase